MGPSKLVSSVALVLSSIVWNPPTYAWELIHRTAQTVADVTASTTHITVLIDRFIKQGGHTHIDNRILDALEVFLSSQLWSHNISSFCVSLSDGSTRIWLVVGDDIVIVIERGWIKIGNI
jgi:hypothetical protein